MSSNGIEWSPLDLDREFHFTFKSYALMILNCTINFDAAVTKRLWENSICTITVDGGTDQWFNYVNNTGITVSNRNPNIVSGDFDSIKPDTLEFCRRQGINVVETPDQDYTDFEKGVRVVTDKLETSIDCVVVICDNAGRLDQTISNLNVLRLGETLKGKPKIFMLSGDSLTWHLSRGKHQISIPRQLIDQQQWCAILPFEPKMSSITTTGLKWNLDHDSVNFGGMISSSNTYAGNEIVTLETDTEVLWSMGLWNTK